MYLQIYLYWLYNKFIICNTHNFKKLHSCVFFFQTLETSILVWSLYCIIIGAIFVLIKLVNFKLHHLFDTGEAETEATAEDEQDGTKTAADDTARQGYGNYICILKAFPSLSSIYQNCL